MDRCSRIFYSGIKGRERDEVCGRPMPPGGCISEPVLRGRLYGRLDRFGSPRSPKPLPFAPLSTRDFPPSSASFQNCFNARQSCNSSIVLPGNEKITGLENYISLTKSILICRCVKFSNACFSFQISLRQFSHLSL